MSKPLPGAPPGPPGSLAAALATVPDPRHPNGWRPDCPPLPLVGLLQLAVAAMLCGACSLYAVAQWGRERVADDPYALVPLGLPAGRSPCVATLHRIFKALDVAAFEAALGAWLAASGVGARDALAVDGKTLRGIHGDAVPGVHLVAAYAHRAGAVLGQAASPGKGQELAAVEAVLEVVPLKGRVVTGDALLTQRDVCHQIVAGQGDYLLPVDENQPALLAAVAAAFSPLGDDRAGQLGGADGGAVAGGGTAAAGRRDGGGDTGGPEGAPRAAGDAAAVGAGRPGSQRLRRGGGGA
jgi:DDE_Tnp_1-associated/Transposase DDE domain